MEGEEEEGEEEEEDYNLYNFIVLNNFKR